MAQNSRKLWCVSLPFVSRKSQWPSVILASGTGRPASFTIRPLSVAAGVKRRSMTIGSPPKTI